MSTAFGVFVCAIGAAISVEAHYPGIAAAFSLLAVGYMLEKIREAIESLKK